MAAILFPVFARARENARRASCQNNLKQLGLGLLQYTQDFDEKLPCGAMLNGNGQGWGAQVFAYVKSTQVYKCPSDSSKLYDAVSGHSKVSYAYNTALVTPDTGKSLEGRITAFNASAKTVLLCEVSRGSAFLDQGQETDHVSPSTAGLGGFIQAKAYNNGTCGFYATGTMGTGTYAVTTVTNPNDTAGHFCDDGGKATSEGGRHLEGSNFLLADGHVKWFKGSAVSNGYIAASTKSAQATPDEWRAEGTENGAHAITFSPL